MTWRTKLLLSWNIPNCFWCFYLGLCISYAKNIVQKHCIVTVNRESFVFKNTRTWMRAVYPTSSPGLLLNPSYNFYSFHIKYTSKQKFTLGYPVRIANLSFTGLSVMVLSLQALSSCTFSAINFVSLGQAQDTATFNIVCPPKERHKD